MRPIILIARRELAGYLKTWQGYIIIAIALFLDAALFNARALNGDKRSAEALAAFFHDVSGVTMIASVLISMRLLAEERQAGTINLLYSSPVRDSEIVLGKFFSALAFLAILTLSTAFMPMMIMIHGKISFGQVLAGYLGLLLLGSASLAVGTFGSSLAKNQIVAAVVSSLLMAILVMAWTLALVTDRPFQAIFNALALHNLHFLPFASGIVHLRDVVFYLALTYVFLFAATRAVEARRWS
jgi:ABC-2 type transport system permease protein